MSTKLNSSHFRIVSASFIFAASIMLVGCKDIVSGFLDSSSSTPYSFKSSVYSGVPTNYSYKLPVQGGFPPYKFRVVSGPGSINSSSGVYSSGGSVGTALIEVKDSRNLIIYKNLEVVNPLVLNQGGTLPSFSDLNYSVSGGSGSDYEFIFPSYLSSFWNSLTQILTRPWSSASFSMSVKDKLGFSQTFAFDFAPGSLVYPAPSTGWNWFDYIYPSNFDSNGDFYVVGNFYDGTFGPMTDPDGAGRDFVIKYDMNGKIVWTKDLGGTAEPSFWNHKVKGDYVYVGGTSYSTGLLNGQAVSARAGYVFKIRKSDGFTEWYRIFDAANNDMITDLDVDNDGNVYVSGTSYGNIFGSPLDVAQDAFLSKLSSDGTVQWITFQGAKTGYHPSVSIKPNGNIVMVAGTDGNSYAANLSHLRQPLVSAFSPNGTRLWSTQMPTTIANVDAWSQGNQIQSSYLGNKTLICAGQRNYSGNWDTVALSLSVVDENGNVEFSHELTSGAPFSSDPRCVVDSDAIYVAFKSDSPFETVNNSLFDVVVLKYDFNGNRIWSKKIETLIDSNRNIGRGFLKDNQVYFQISGTGHFVNGTDLHHDAGLVMVGSTEELTVDYLGYNFEATDDSWHGSFIGYNPHTGYLFDAGWGGDIELDGYPLSSSGGGSYISKFNSSLERQ